MSKIPEIHNRQYSFRGNNQVFYLFLSYSFTDANSLKTMTPFIDNGIVMIYVELPDRTNVPLRQ